MPHDFAFATYAEIPTLYRADQQVADRLTARGFTVEALPWDSPAVDWAGYRAVVIRSTWDYFDKPAAFAAWLDQLERLGVPVLNPVALVRWNMVKTYLRQLEQHGVRIVPTAWVEQGSTPDLAALIDSRGWGDVLLKPTISGGAIGIHKVPAGTAAQHQRTLHQMAQAGAVMVQPLLREIHDGEISILFADGVYTHSVRKYPAADNIFVQEIYGGRAEPYQPEPALIEQARTLLETARTLTGVDGIAYARVDGLLLGGQFHLMELEVIEPYLFLDDFPAAADAFAQALITRSQR
jgi:glutathione synthase/RimK-type ligase-like ATP-grasp enzyme